MNSPKNIVPHDYAQLATSSNLIDVPLDWSVVVADVRGSTQAVQEGKYRDVNLIGAACIAAVRNEFPPQTIPYVFGGDGASYLVPPDKLNRTLALLNGVKEMAWNNMKLFLRVGHLSVNEIKQLGGQIAYGFIPQSEYEALAYFRGNGVALAEKEIKKHSDQIADSKSLSTPNEKVNLSGLSCSFSPFKSKRGEILSVIIELQTEGEAQDKVLNTIIETLRNEGNLQRVNPIGLENYKRTMFGDRWMAEAMMNAKDKRFFSIAKSVVNTFINHVAVYLSFLFRFSIPGIGDPDIYDQTLVLQSDWIKMDGALRLVIDVDEDEKEQLIQTLDQLQKDQLIDYGINSSNSAVMVCHYQSGVELRHTHFIDGMDGGLTRAAADLKRKKESNT